MMTPFELFTNSYRGESFGLLRERAALPVEPLLHPLGNTAKHDGIDHRIGVRAMKHNGLDLVSCIA